LKTRRTLISAGQQYELKSKHKIAIESLWPVFRLVLQTLHARLLPSTPSRTTGLINRSGTGLTATFRVGLRANFPFLDLPLGQAQTVPGRSLSLPCRFGSSAWRSRRHLFSSGCYAAAPSAGVNQTGARSVDMTCGLRRSVVPSVGAMSLLAAEAEAKKEVTAVTLFFDLIPSIRKSSSDR